MTPILVGVSRHMKIKILVVGGLLILFGIFSIYSVSIFESFDLTLNQVSLGVRTEPSNYYFFFEQLLKLIIGLAVCGIVYLVPLERIKQMKYVIFFGSLAMVLLLFTPLWVQLNGSSAWLSVPWWTIQPGEFFKIGFVMFLAAWMLRKNKQLDEMQFFIWFLIMTGIFYLLFLLIPDLGTILVLACVAMIMFWYAWGKIYYIFVTILLGVIAGVLATSQFSYIHDRMVYFFNPDSDTSWRGIGWQTKQALIAVGWGGWIGKWYGKWLQKFWYIPEAQSDFIFAAFSEEIWFLGNCVLLTLYFLLAYFFLKDLHKIKDPYNRLLWVGLLSMIIIQVFINIWVNIKLVPLTWLTLPFISHGGSALIANMVELVILQKILRGK